MIIYLLVRNPSEGRKKKKIFDQELGLLETCVESVLSGFIITVIWVSVGGTLIFEKCSRGEKITTIFDTFMYVTPFTGRRDTSLFNIIFNPQSPSLFTRIFGLSPSHDVALAEFSITYIISIISAALGLAKCLKNGVARPIGPGGPLDGLLTAKFLLAFLASAGVLVAEGVYISYSWVVRKIS